MWTLINNKEWKALEQEFSWVRQMQSVAQDPVHHAEGNVAIHTQMVLQELQNLPSFTGLSLQEQEILWAAALLHDVEKFSTTVVEPNGSVTAKGHAKKGALRSRQILYRELPTPFLIREQVVALVRYHGLPLWLFDKMDPLKELVRVSMEANTQWLALLARADALGRSCSDKNELLYRIDCFEEFCKEHHCWGQERKFSSAHARMHYLLREDAYIDYQPFDSPVFEVVLMSGLPGAGKDNYIWRNFKDVPVVSLDDIRREMKISPTDKSGNGKVIQAGKELARTYLRKQRSFIWNATNITRQMRGQLIELFMTYKAAVKIVYVEAPYLQLYAQNRNRQDVVPAAAVERLIDKLEVPAPWEAHELDYHFSA